MTLNQLIDQLTELRDSGYNGEETVVKIPDPVAYGWCWTNISGFMEDYDVVKLDSPKQMLLICGE